MFMVWCLIISTMNLCTTQRSPFLPRLGPRFPDISAAYDSELRRLALTVSKQLGMESFTREGVISVLGGPSYETVAECRALRSLGADVTGTHLLV